ncbi:Ig-like domain repeat protein [Microbacterium tumbae]
MTDNPMTRRGRRRGLRSAAALGVAAAVGLSGLVATPAFAAPGGSSTGTGVNHATLTPTLTVTPGQDLNADGDTTLTLSGDGYATTNDFGANFGGAYLLFGVVSPKDSADAGSWAPSKSGISGVNYDYAAGAGVYQSLINYPGNDTEPGLGYMDADGDWETTLTIPGARFTSQAGNEIDCLDGETVCGVITIGAHGQRSSGVEVFTPVTFAEESGETVAPSFTTQPADITVAEGEDATFSVSLTGDPEPTIQWQTRIAGGEWDDVEDATSTELTLEAVTIADDGREFRALASNEAAQDVASDVAALTVEASTPEHPDGAAVGTPLEGNTSYIVVTPGEDVDGTDAVSFTLNGYGFDPGPVVEPGTGTGGIYVGFGTKKDTDSSETWRRSKGGSSGPVGQGDYTYGSPVFVANQGTGDADVADGVMNADGEWTATLTIPGSSLPSFFGDTIDCTQYECGVFSFGAHGVVKAANEAYTAVSFAEQAVPATPTTTTLAAQPSTGTPVLVGDEVTLSATVAPADAAGSVEFFRGETSLGEATVAEGAASVTTSDAVGGAQQLTAVFTPEDDALFEASTSAERTYRFVDLEPIVGAIEVGTAASEIADATLNWTIANFVSFGSAPAKSALSGDVVLSELPEGATAADRAAQELVFSNGTGVTDADGDSVVSFEGEAQLTSGSANRWTFADPEVRTAADGSGYITAEVTTEFLGASLGMTDEVQGPVRVVVSTFTGAESSTEEGTTSLEATPVFEGQFAAGSWSGSYTGGTFANETLVLVSANVRSFFLQSGSSADSTKAGLPIGLSYSSAEIAAPSLTVEPRTGLDRAGAVVSVTGESFEATAKPTYPGAPDAPAGSYVSLGWISNDGWRPSEGAASATRVAVTTKWVQQTNATEGQYVRWSIGSNGRASFAFDFDGISYADVLAKKPATGDYRLAVYSVGASGVVQAANELAYDVEFAPAAATSLSLSPQQFSDFPTDFAGEDVTVSATVSPAVDGLVEFFADGESLGSAEVEDGAATLVTDAFTGGAHAVTATFVPEDAVLYEGSSSAAQTFRIVDLARAVDDIQVGTAVEQITGAELEWTIANYWSPAGYVFAKEAVSGDVTVPGDAGSSEANSNRAFTFTDGTGHRDADGNTVIDFTAVARVSSGTASQWNFADPQLLIAPNGDGYITAEFSGYFRIEGLAEHDYAPQRVTIATFTGADAATADGTTSFTVAPTWEGQTAAGTWAGEYTGSFPNEFSSLLYSGIRSFFYQSGASADANKPVKPIAVSYVAGSAPAVAEQPSDAAVTAGEDASFEAAFSGSPAPTVQWQTLQDGEWADLDGATDETLVLTEVPVSAHGTQFRAIATNAFGEVTTGVATLDVAPVQPAEEPSAPTIGDEDEGGFEVISIEGRTVTVRVPAEYENTWLGVHLHSDPVFLGWTLVRDGELTVTVPADAYGEHRLSFVSADGDLLGWAAITLPAAPVDGGDDDADGSGAGGGDLAVTGGGLPLMAGGVALLLLMAGATLLLVRARRRTAAE